MTRILLPQHSARQTGTYQISDLRANYMSIYQFGLANALAVVTAQLVAYNTMLSESLATLTTTTTERQEASPGSANVRMMPVDEFGLVRTQKNGLSYGRGFPLERYQFATGWTEDFMAQGTVSDLVIMTDSAQLAHTNQVRQDMAQALYNPIQRVLREYTNPAIGFQTLTGVFVKPLFNADGEIPSTGPAGQIFDGTHNHYLFSNGLSVTALDALTNTVGEHSTGNSLRIYINAIDASLMRATAGFVPALIAQVVAPNNTFSTTTPLDVSQTDNKFIGYTSSGIPVLVKPWALQNYALCINLGGVKPLKRRIHPAPILQGYRIKGDQGEVSLFSRYWEDSFGFGISNRAGASVLYFATGASVYVAPVFDDSLVLG